MASKYWLKLFHETIYDPKIMMRSPGARLRWYECLCLAGDYDKDGELPPIEHMLYVFRIPEDQLVKELEELVISGLLTLDGEIYSIKNWSTRQAAMEPSERTSRFRGAERKREYYEPVTKVKLKGNEPVTNRYIDIDKEVDKDKEKIKEIPEKSSGSIPSKEKPIKPKRPLFSENQLILANLFHDVTGAKIPAYSTSTQIASVKATWFNPIRDMLDQVDNNLDEAKSIMEFAIDRQRKWGGTISTPKSIKSEFIGITIDENLKRNS